jgi:hypothetical protein
VLLAAKAVNTMEIAEMAYVPMNLDIALHGFTAVLSKRSETDALLE